MNPLGNDSKNVALSKETYLCFPDVLCVRLVFTKGFVLSQAILKYNVQENDPSDALSISVKSKPKPSQKQCLKHIVGKLQKLPALAGMAALDAYCLLLSTVCFNRCLNSLCVLHRHFYVRCL